MTDPVSTVAAWLSPPTKVDEPIDPLLGLITEHKSVVAKYREVYHHAKEIEAALPENVRQGVPFVIPPGAEPDEVWKTEFFTTQEQLVKTVAPWRRFAITAKRVVGKISEAEAAAEYDDEIAPFLAEFCAGLVRNQEIREASGCEALWREYDALVNRSAEIEEQIAGTPAVTLAGLMAQVEFLRDINVRGELWPNWDAIVAGIKNVASSIG